MISKLNPILQILDDFYSEPLTSKILSSPEPFITSDPSKVISHINTQDTDLKYFLQILKQVLNSNLCHRRSFIRIIKSLLVFCPLSDFNILKGLLQSSLTQIKTIFESIAIDLKTLSDEEIRNLAFEGFDKSLQECRIYDITSANTCKIKG